MENTKFICNGCSTTYLLKDNGILAQYFPAPVCDIIINYAFDINDIIIKPLLNKIIDSKIVSVTFDKEMDLKYTRAHTDYEDEYFDFKKQKNKEYKKYSLDDLYYVDDHTYETGSYIPNIPNKPNDILDPEKTLIVTQCGSYGYSYDRKIKKKMMKFIV